MLWTKKLSTSMKQQILCANVLARSIGNIIGYARFFFLAHRSPLWTSWNLNKHLKDENLVQQFPPLETIICKLQAIYFEMMCSFLFSSLARNCRNELFPLLSQNAELFGPSTNQNNGSSSSLKLYRFNGVRLQLSAKQLLKQHAAGKRRAVFSNRMPESIARWLRSISQFTYT